MPSAVFKAGENFTIQSLSNSGLAFMGNSWGSSIAVGAWNDSTWISDGSATTQGPGVDNAKYAGHPNSGYINGVLYNLLNVPNYLATLAIDFIHSTAIRTVNNQFRIYDRSNINNDPSGILCYCCELLHDSESPAVQGSGDTSWVNVHGSGSVLSLVDSPGVSGFNAMADNVSTDHRHHILISCSPSSIGEKLFAGYFSCEYL